MEIHRAHLDVGNVEHVLVNNVIGEAMLATQRAKWILGEPCSLTKSPEHVVWDFIPAFFHLLHSPSFDHHLPLLWCVLFCSTLNHNT